MLNIIVLNIMIYIIIVNAKTFDPDGYYKALMEKYQIKAPYVKIPPRLSVPDMFHNSELIINEMKTRAEKKHQEFFNSPSHTKYRKRIHEIQDNAMAKFEKKQADYEKYWSKFKTQKKPDVKLMFNDPTQTLNGLKQIIARYKSKLGLETDADALEWLRSHPEVHPFIYTELFAERHEFLLGLRDFKSCSETSSGGKP